MVDEGLEVAILVQQQMTVLDAERRDDRVDRLAHGYAALAQVSGSWRQRGWEFPGRGKLQRDSFEFAEVTMRASTAWAVVTCALWRSSSNDEIADEDRCQRDIADLSRGGCLRSWPVAEVPRSRRNCRRGSVPGSEMRSLSRMASRSPSQPVPSISASALHLADSVLRMSCRKASSTISPSWWACPVSCMASASNLSSMSIFVRMANSCV